MPQGKLEVFLINAKGLKNSDLMKNMDPYVIITYRSTDQQSSVASGQGCEPEWNERFWFSVSGDPTDLTIKIKDHDVISDDFLGLARIPMKTVFEEGSVPEASYNVTKNGEFSGEVRLAFEFTAQVHRNIEKEIYGGWQQSSIEY